MVVSGTNNSYTGSTSANSGVLTINSPLTGNTAYCWRRDAQSECRGQCRDDDQRRQRGANEFERSDQRHNRDQRFRRTFCFLGGGAGSISGGTIAIANGATFDVTAKVPPTPSRTARPLTGAGNTAVNGAMIVASGATGPAGRSCRQLVRHNEHRKLDPQRGQHLEL